MQTGLFYVKVRPNLDKDYEDFFPYISKSYLAMAKVLQVEKEYPVLAVESISIFDEDRNERQTARFLIPTENNNFMWFLSEVFIFSRLDR